MSIRVQAINAFLTLKQKHPSAELHVTGHSLGGALASLFSIDIYDKGYKITRRYTFGAPRYGN